MVVQNPKRDWGHILGTKDYYSLLVYIKSMLIHLILIYIQWNVIAGSKSFSFFFSMRHIYVRVDNGNSNGLAGLCNRILCRYGQKKK